MSGDGKLLITVPLSVRWGDMDAFGHVNNAAYATFVEEARLRWFATIEGGWIDETSSPILAAQHINYRIPAEWPCELAIELFLARMGASSVTLGFRMLDRARPARCYADGDQVLVWIARATGRPMALPERVRKAVGASTP